jgi:hypothetical protein
VVTEGRDTCVATGTCLYTHMHTCMCVFVCVHCFDACHDATQQMMRACACFVKIKLNIGLLFDPHSFGKSSVHARQADGMGWDARAAGFFEPIAPGHGMGTGLT